jgi:hypothetical protein
VRFMHASSRRGRETRPDRDDAGGPAGPRLWPKRWAVVVALAAAPLMIGSLASAATGWSVVTVPQTGNSTILTGASAVSSTDAWAVGEQFAAAGQAPPPPVSYQWNGSVWSLVATPTLGVTSSLLSVSGSSATDAWAVGMSVLGKHDDGTLMEHWNGTSWSVNSSLVVTGYTAELTGVVDLSPTNAWAVGEANSSLLEHWNGSTWSEVTIPDPDFTPGANDSISASSASDIWVVGSTLNTATDELVPEALHYNGAAWSVVAMPQAGTNSSTIGAVTDISPTDAWAVGEDIGATSAVGGSTLIEHWNGSSWSIVPSPTPGADPGLTGVAARGADDVYAVGSNLPSVNGGTVQGMILRWNGSTWSADTDPTAGSYSPLFAAATVPGAANEWAVGTLSNASLILSHG